MVLKLFDNLELSPAPELSPKGDSSGLCTVALPHQGRAPSIWSRCAYFCARKERKGAKDSAFFRPFAHFRAPPTAKAV